MCIYIYIYRERERDMYVCMYVYIYIYIYILVIRFGVLGLGILSLRIDGTSQMKSEPPTPTRAPDNKFRQMPYYITPYFYKSCWIHQFTQLYKNIHQFITSIRLDKSL